MNEDQKILKAKVTKIEITVNALENYSRCNSVVVQSIPYQENENPLKVTINAEELVGVNLNLRDIDIAHIVFTAKTKNYQHRL